MIAEDITVYLLGAEPEIEQRLSTLFVRSGLSANLMPCADLAQAVDADPRPNEVLILARCVPDECDAAEAAVNGDGLPRWSVFDLNSDQPLGEATIRLTLEEPESFRRLISVGLERHRLRCQNLQMAGDFRSLSRRLCHDLRTPLSCIQTVLSVLEGSGGVPGMPAALTESASTSTQELARMVDQLAMLGRTWGAPSEAVPVDLGETHDEACHSLRRRMPDRAFEVDRPTALPEAAGVLSWVEFIWETFFVYALEHDKNGRLPVGYHRTDDGMHRCEVRIAGQADTAERVAQDFLPFHLLAEQRGRGRIDFALARRFCRLMEGDCGCTAEEGDLVLYFTLPPV